MSIMKNLPADEDFLETSQSDWIEYLGLCGDLGLEPWNSGCKWYQIH